MINKIIVSILAVAFFLVILSGCDQVTEPETIPDNFDNENYELLWFDEFNGSDVSLDESKWGYDTGYGGEGWGNDEWQLYTNEPENVRVEDGNMVITAVWDSVNYSEPGERDGSITSARVNTKDKYSVKYGKVQARIKPPTGMGMWPAFWMLGDSFDSVGWPQCGEIDIMEMSPLYHNDNTTMFNLHWWNEAGEYHDYDGAFREFSYSLTDDYHIFEVEWDEQRIIGKIDDITYYTKLIDPDQMDEFMKKFFLIFNIAVGGNLGGSPDDETQWNQKMYVDWVRVYQSAGPDIGTYGIFTDETVVDAGLEVGVNAEIYVWENTLSGGTMPPYEGLNVISWSSTGAGWFGGGISSTLPVDLSGFAYGNLKFMIKIPANVTFKIGINDTDGIENYVIFPANETAYGLVRDGEWGQATIPVDEITGNVDLEILDYEFIILEENGTPCEFALDDIYWDGGGTIPSSVSFDADSYAIDASGAVITVNDLAAAGNTVSVSVDNGTETISVDFVLDAMGMGAGTLNFGPTDDTTDTIAITAGGSLAATYTDGNGNVKTDIAVIESGSTGDELGIFTESHNTQMLVYQQIWNSADWSGNPAEPDEQSTGVTPVDGIYVLSVNFEAGGAGWGGIAFDFGTPGQDISAYNTLIININKSAMPTLNKLGIKFEDNLVQQTEVNITYYTPIVTGDWMRYEIPLSDFDSPDHSDIKYLGLWNPQDSGNTLLTGFLYFDDIYLINR
jgi:beta-glucanase (GH16 family)